MTARFHSGVHKAERRLIQFVDDYVDNCLMYAEALVDLGFTVEISHDANDALAKARAVRPAAIVMDLCLPGVDGYETTRRLKADPLTCDIPVIALTGMPLQRCMQAALDVGCVSVLGKPCLPERIAFEVERLLLAREAALRSAS